MHVCNSYCKEAKELTNRYCIYAIEFEDGFDSSLNFRNAAFSLEYKCYMIVDNIFMDLFSVT